MVLVYVFGVFVSPGSQTVNTSLVTLLHDTLPHQLDKMFLPLPLGAVFDFMTLELPMNVTAAVLCICIAPPRVCSERKKETREELERYSKEEEKK